MVPGRYLAVIFSGSKIGARPHILTAIGSAKLAYQNAFNYPNGERLEG